MGIIGRQAGKLTIANFFSVFIGFFNILYIYPLDKGIYGLAMFVITVGGLMEMFANMGLPTMTLRFFPSFKSPQNGNRGYLSFAFIYLGIGLVFFTLLFWFFANFFFQILKDNHPENTYYLSLFFDAIPIIVGLITLQSFLISYLSQFQRVVIPGIIFSLLPKIWIPVVFLLAYYKYFSDQMLVNSVILMLFTSTVLMLIYLYRLGQFDLRPQWQYYPKVRLKEMISFALLSLLGTAGSQLAFRIDQSMLGSILGMEALGLFSMALTFTSTIEMPAKSVLSITAPIISDLIKKENYAEVESLYQRTALNMFAVGVFLVLGLYLVADDVFRLTKNAQTLLIAQQIALILSISKLLDMISGPNDLIITLSKYYLFNLFCIFILSLGNVLLNFTFIASYGVFGPAFASLLFMFVFNLIKVIFIKVKMNMLPFTLNMAYLLGLAALCVGLHLLLPKTGWVICDLALGGLILITVYIFPLIFWKLAPDLTNMIQGGISNLGITLPWQNRSK